MIARRDWRREVPGIFQEDFYAVVMTLSSSSVANYYEQLKTDAPERVPDFALATKEQLENGRMRAVLIDIAMKEQRCDLVELWAEYRDEAWLKALGRYFTRALLPIANLLLEKNELSGSAARILIGVKALRPLITPLLASKPYRYLKMISASALEFIGTLYDLNDPRVLWEYLRSGICSRDRVRWLMERHKPQLDYAHGLAPTLGELAEANCMLWVVDPTLHSTLVVAATGHPVEAQILMVLAGLARPGEITDEQATGLVSFFREHGLVTMANRALRWVQRPKRLTEDMPLEWLISRSQRSDITLIPIIVERLRRADRRECAVAFTYGIVKPVQNRLRSL